MSSALSTLIELAERATDESAVTLGRAIQSRDDLDKKLILLKNYREEYAARLQAELQKGRGIQHIRNFQIFIAKIDDAINVQHQLISSAQQRVHAEQKNWQEQERKKMSFVTLEERAEKVLQQKEVRRERLQNDEFGMRQLSRKQA